MIVNTVLSYIPGRGAGPRTGADLLNEVLREPRIFSLRRVQCEAENF